MAQNNFRRTLRLYNQNLIGENTIRQELTKIKGIGKITGSHDRNEIQIKQYKCLYE